ncbi:MAG: septum formation initiator family protein [Myxococcales bacterium]|nr:septum formation initiator family protein [Myxococcales bacterium]
MKLPRPRSRPILLAPLAVLLATVLWLGADRETGLGAMLDLRGEVRQAQARVGDLVRERTALLQRVRALRSDPLTLEREARVKLGMARPGEVIVRWIEPEQAPAN